MFSMFKTKPIAVNEAKYGQIRGQTTLKQVDQVALAQRAEMVVHALFLPNH